MNKHSINSVITSDGQRAPIKFKREKNGEYTAYVLISSLSGIQFNPQHDDPMVRLEPDSVRDENGLVYGHEYNVGKKVGLRYDHELSKYFISDDGPSTHTCTKMISMTTAAH